MSCSTRCSARALLVLVLLAGGAPARAEDPAPGQAPEAPAPPAAEPATPPTEPATAAEPAPPGAATAPATPAAHPAAPHEAAASPFDQANKRLLRLVVLPIENLTGRYVPGKELTRQIEAALVSSFDLTTGEELEQFLSRHRLRWTGGLDAAAGLAARDELGADGVLITTVTSLREDSPPVLSLTMRLVTTGEDPVIAWMDTASKAGDDEPGVLGLGVVAELGALRDLLLGRLLASLQEAKAGRGDRMGAPCPGDRWSRPRVAFRSPLLDGDGAARRVAVLPFLNKTGRRGAGEATSLELVRQLAASGRYQVLEPGVVRDFLLRRRIMVPAGVSLETSRLFVGALGVDLLLSGTILDYDETGLPRGPTIRFSIVGLEGGTGEVVWSSSSFSHGDDGVWFFSAGRVATAARLTCNMMGAVVERFLGASGSSPLPPLDRTLRDRLLKGGVQALAAPPHR